MKSKIFLVELSPVKPDGGRDIVKDEIIATCDNPGTAALICMYLKEGAYKTMLSPKADNETMYIMTVERRKQYRTAKAL